MVPLYCFDPRQFCATPWENAKTGAVRAQFLLQSVLDLKQNLRRIGSDLVIHLGMPEDAIKGMPIFCASSCAWLTLSCTHRRQLTGTWDMHAGLLPEGGGSALVLAQSEITSEEAEADAGILASLGQRGRLQLLWGNTLFHIDDLPFEPGMADLPDVFTPFRNKARACAFGWHVPCTHELLRARHEHQVNVLVAGSCVGGEQMSGAASATSACTRRAAAASIPGPQDAGMPAWQRGGAEQHCWRGSAAAGPPPRPPQGAAHDATRKSLLPLCVPVVGWQAWPFLPMFCI